ncbi:MAG TPA: hypothetical protein VGH02_12195 [Rhizomicrobium sp.]|jgi:hypothetical protein
MAVWVPVGDGFIEADVIRWKEPVFKNRRRGQPARVGERLVIAEVLDDSGGGEWVHLLVRGSQVVSAHPGWNPSDVPLPATESETRRRRRTLVKGNPERLEWSDESARAIVASERLGRRNPAPPVCADTEEDFSLRSSFNPVSSTNRNRVGTPKWELPIPRY